MRLSISVLLLFVWIAFDSSQGRIDQSYTDDMELFQMPEPIDRDQSEYAVDVPSNLLAFVGDFLFSIVLLLAHLSIQLNNK